MKEESQMTDQDKQVVEATQEQESKEKHEGHPAEVGNRPLYAFLETHEFQRKASRLISLIVIVALLNLGWVRPHVD